MHFLMAVPISKNFVNIIKENFIVWHDVHNGTVYHLGCVTSTIIRYIHNLEFGDELNLWTCLPEYIYMYIHRIGNCISRLMQLRIRTHQVIFALYKCTPLFRIYFMDVFTWNIHRLTNRKNRRKTPCFLR